MSAPPKKTDPTESSLDQFVLDRIQKVLAHFIYFHCGTPVPQRIRGTRAVTEVGMEFQLAQSAKALNLSLSCGERVSLDEVAGVVRTLARRVRDVRVMDDPYLVQETFELLELVAPGEVAASAPAAPAPEAPPAQPARAPEAGPTGDSAGPTQHDRPRRAELDRALARLGSEFSYGAVGEVSEADAAWDRPRSVTALGLPAMRRLPSGRLLHVTVVPLAALRQPAGHDAALLVAALLQSMPIVLASELDRRAQGDPTLEVLSLGDFDADKPVSMLSWLYRSAELGAHQILVIDCAGQDEAGRTSILREFVRDGESVRLL